MSNQFESHDEICYQQLEEKLSILSSKWTLLILRDLINGTKRFAELQKSLHGITPKTLSSRLQALEKSNIISKRYIRKFLYGLSIL